MKAPPDTVASLIEVYLWYKNHGPRTQVVDGVKETQEASRSRYETLYSGATDALKEAIEHYGEVAWEGEAYRVRVTARTGPIVQSPFGGYADTLPWPPTPEEPHPLRQDYRIPGGVGASPLTEKVAVIWDVEHERLEEQRRNRGV